MRMDRAYDPSTGEHRYGRERWREGGKGGRKEGKCHDL